MNLKFKIENKNTLQTYYKAMLSYCLKCKRHLESINS